VTTQPITIAANALEGQAELRDKFSKLRAIDQPKVIRSAVRAAVRPIVKDARNRAPVRTGALRKSINVKVDRTRDRTGFVATVGFGKDQFYGIFSEVGTPTQPARPFLRPAMEAKKGEVINSFFAGMLKRINKIAAKAGR